MERKIYISNNIIALSEYIKSEDDLNNYNCFINKKLGFFINSQNMCHYFILASLRNK